jgi:hypothetical protein
MSRNSFHTTTIWCSQDHMIKSTPDNSFDTTSYFNVAHKEITWGCATLLTPQHVHNFTLSEITQKLSSASHPKSAMDMKPSCAFFQFASRKNPTNQILSKNVNRKMDFFTKSHHQSK